LPQDLINFLYSVHSLIQNVSTGVDFTNVLRAAFTSADPKSAQRHWWPDGLFAVLGSVHKKTTHKTLVKPTIGVPSYY